MPVGRAGHRVAFVLFLTGVAIVAFESGARGGTASDVPQQPAAYVDPPRVGSFPTSNARIQGWIAANQQDSIRQHGWDIWRSITSPACPTCQIVPQTPVWQTWWSGHELFEMSSGETRLHARAVRGQIAFEPQVMSVHLPCGRPSGEYGIPYNPCERVFAFNRFSRDAARFIWSKKLNNGNFLMDTLQRLVSNNVPLASIEVLTSKDSTDSLQFVLKPVFQLISGHEVTAVPVWAGNDTSRTYTPGNPTPENWRQAVAVDPTGRYKPGDHVYLPINNEHARWLEVVPLSAFYWVRITRDDSINFTQFGAENGDFIGLANDTSYQAVMNAVRPGNIALLMAMHVTGKEIPNWTWQSYWWSLHPSDSTTGRDRPKSIPAPWNHYDMTVTYSMVNPINGDSVIGFNPYLETSLGGRLPLSLTDTTTFGWTGVSTNCMSCHRRAALAWVGGTPVGPPYGPDMNIAAGDSLVFTQPNPSGNGTRVPVLKTDFLWSVAIRASTPDAAHGGPKKRR